MIQKKSIKEKYGLDVDSYIELKENVLLLSLVNKENLILKKRRITNKNFMDDHRFDNEVRMYNYVNEKELKHLHTARILSKEKKKVSEILLEYIPKLEEKEINVNEFVEAYLELQLLDVPRKFKLDIINEFCIGFFYKIVIVSLFTLRKRVNIPTRLKILWLYFKLTLSCSRLDKEYWLHGDLNNRNFFYNKKNNLLYFIDFENMFYTSKWVLSEVIAKCFSYDPDEKKLNINLEFMFKYLEKAPHAIKDFHKINLKQHFKFALLQKCIQVTAQSSIIPKRKEYVKLLDMCIHDALFEAWYGTNVEPALSTRIKKLIPY
jgi:hypothetical protein